MKLLIFFLLILIISTNVKAISISGDALTVEEFYEQGKIRNYGYKFVTQAFQQDHIVYKYSAAGHDITPYITISRTEFPQMPPNTIGEFSVTLDFTDEVIPPGLHEARVVVKETQGPAGTVGAVASVGVRFLVVSLSPTEFIKWSLSATNANVGEESTITSVVRNWGVPQINDLYIEYKIYDSKNNLLKEITTGKYSIESKGVEGIKTIFSTQDFKPADYLIKAKVYFADQIQESETRFRVGTKTVKINSITPEYVPNAINKAAINVESGWNEDIKEIKGYVNILEGTEVVSRFDLLPQGLNAWQKNSMIGFFDTNGLELGKYSAEVNLRFDEEIAQKTFEITIAESANTKTVEQIPGQIQWFSPSTLIIILLIMILIFNIVYLIKRKK